MKMKLLAALLALCLLLCSCGGGSTASEAGTDTALGFGKHSTSPKEDLLTEPISLWTAWRNGILRPFARPDTTHPLGFSWLNNQFPIQCLRTPTADSAYALYKSGDGGYLYVFFDKQGTDYSYSHWAYMGQRLKRAAFEHIELGDLRNEVFMVDPASRTIVQAAEDYPQLIQWSPYIPTTNSHTFHILEDGLLVIRYDDNDRVQQIIFKEDYTYNIKVGELSKAYKFVIFAEDFAPAPTPADPDSGDAA